MNEQGFVIDPDEGGGAPPQPAVEAGPPVIPVAEEPAVEAADPEDATLEAEAVNVQGGRYVPVAAIRAARQEARQAKAAAKALAERAGQLQAEHQQLIGWAQQARPYVELLRNNPDLLKPRAATPEPAEPVADPEAEELARTLSLYTPEGQPDVRAAQRVMAISDKRAEQKARAAVQPMEDRAVVGQAKANIQKMFLETKDANGQPIPVEAWRQVLQPFTQNPALLTNPDVVELVKVTAAGWQALHGKPQAPAPARPPVFTEAPGGGGTGAVPPNPLQAQMAKKWGTTPQKVAAIAAKYNPEMPAVLEE